MTIDLTDTTTSAIHDALTQARRAMGGPASGMVLTLIVVTGEAEQYDAVRAASHAGRRDPGGRDRAGRDDPAPHVRPARAARRLGGGTAARAGRPRCHLVARRRAARASG